MAARAAAQIICKRGCRGQTQERMQGRLCSSKSRFSGCRNDSSESPGLIGGCTAQPQAPAVTAQTINRESDVNIAIRSIGSLIYKNLKLRDGSEACL